jgi:hypothetical protein
MISSARWRISGVPEGVLDAARLEDEVAGPGYVDLVSDLDADLAFEHVSVLVLAFVCVQRRGQDSRPDGMLDEREGAAALGTLDH